MASVEITKTPFERAEPVGKRILAEARADREKRREASNKEIYQASKEAGTYLHHKSRGRVSLGGGASYCCFECTERLTEGCRFCVNGSHFSKKEEVAKC
jgi:hypothetical protein